MKAQKNGDELAEKAKNISTTFLLDGSTYWDKENKHRREPEGRLVLFQDFQEREEDRDLKAFAKKVIRDDIQAKLGGNLLKINTPIVNGCRL